MSLNKSSFSRGRSRTQDFTRVNQRIRVPKVRLVDEEGNQLGVADIRAALDKAKEAGLDLVEVAPNTDPPVCRIMDYSKYKYEQEKKRKLAKKKQHVVHIKEIRFKARIEEHDYQVKLKHIKEFLERKDKVRVSLRLRGREMAHRELGMELMGRIAKDISALGEIDSEPKWMGRTLNMSITPKASE
ncbi:MAG: translation initiation factor IF-3 [Candidatus Omnitrophota bacterium]